MPHKQADPQRPILVWRIVPVADRRGGASLGSDLPEDRSDWRPASPRGYLPVSFMFDMISVFVGIIAAMLVLFGSIPFIAMAGWLVAPMAAAGLTLGLLSGSAAGRNLNLLVLVLCLMIAAASHS